MKAKDVALLGFVSAAQEYVKKHMDDGTNLGDLSNIDIKKLREELFNQLKFFDGSNEDVRNLISAGEDAFNDYKDEKLGKTKINIVNLLGNTFEVDKTPEDIKITINDVKEGLLEIDKQNKEEVKEETKEELVDTIDVDETELSDEPQQEETTFGISDDDELYKAISTAASKSDDELAILNKPAPDRLNEVYVDVVNNENAFKDSNILQDTTYDKPLSETLKGLAQQEEPKVEIKKQEELDNPANIQTPIEDYPNVKIIEPSKSQVEGAKLSETLKNIGGNSSLQEEFNPQIEQFSNVHASSDTDIFAHGNPINPDIPQYLQFVENPGVDAVDDDFYRIEPEEDEYEEDYGEKEVVIETEDTPIIRKPKKEYAYTDDNREMDDSALEALEALNEFVDDKEKKIDSEKEIDDTDDNKATYDNIASIFPYLNYDFIKDVYAHRDDIAKAYEEGEEIILLHRCKFKDIDNLHEFVEITMSHDYQVNVDELKMIVDVMRGFENEEGAILSNIYTIANQAEVLNGKYEGYRVITDDER